MEDSNKEKIIKYFPSSITMEKSIIIIDQMKNYICKIKNKNGESTGIFCYIKYENKKMPSLITNNYIVDDNIIKESQIINVSLNDDKEYKKIKIYNNKKIYIDKKNKMTIIEIIPEIDEITNFLEIDENIFNNSQNLLDENIYIIHYQKSETTEKNKISVSYGYLEQFTDNDIKLFCKIGNYLSGFPLLRLSNNKLLGIFNENTNNLNKEMFLKYTISECLNDSNLIKIENKFNLINILNNDMITRNKIPEITETKLGPETEDDDEENEEKTKNKNTNEFPYLKNTILGPETEEEENIIIIGNNSSNSIENNNKKEIINKNNKNINNQNAFNNNLNVSVIYSDINSVKQNNTKTPINSTDKNNNSNSMNNNNVNNSCISENNNINSMKDKNNINFPFTNKTNNLNSINNNNNINNIQFNIKNNNNNTPICAMNYNNNNFNSMKENNNLNHPFMNKNNINSLNKNNNINYPINDMKNKNNLNSMNNNNNINTPFISNNNKINSNNNNINISTPFINNNNNINLMNNNNLNSNSDEMKKQKNNNILNDNLIDNLNINDELNKTSHKSGVFSSNYNENKNKSLKHSLTKEHLNIRTNNNMMMSSMDDMNDYIKKFKNANINMNNQKTNNILNQSFDNIQNLKKCNSNINNFNNNQNNLSNLNNNNNFSDNANNNSINQNDLNFNQDFLRQKYNTTYEEKYSFSRYKKATTTGFKDLGNTSYINSVFHLLGNILELANYFLNPTNIMYININLQKMQLSHLIQRIFAHLYPYPETNKKEIYQPKYHLDYFNDHKIEKNPNSIINFILQILHNELNKLSGNIQNITNLKPNIYEINSIILNGIENNKKLNDSIISNLFNLYEIKECQCSKCNLKSYFYENFTIFNIDILKSFYYFKQKNININNNNNNFFTIYNCLEYRKNIQEQFYCKNCFNYMLHLSSKIIYNCPKILICSLDRGIFDPNLMSIPFYIQEKITINSLQESGKEYELTGIVSIYLDKNKYVSSCKSPVDSKWYFYNDEYIGNADFNIIMKNHNEKKMFIPCILVYKSINVKD